MSKQVRTPKPAQRSGPSYAELKAENEQLRQSLVAYVQQATQYQAIAEKYQTALNAANVLAANASFIILQTLAGALPPALLSALSQQNAQVEDSFRPGAGQKATKPSTDGGGGLAEAPVFSGVAKESGSSVPLSGEASDDGEWVDDDDDDIDSDKV